MLQVKVRRLLMGVGDLQQQAFAQCRPNQLGSMS